MKYHFGCRINIFDSISKDFAAFTIQGTREDVNVQLNCCYSILVWMPEKRHLLIHHFCQPNSVKVRMDSTQLIDGVTVCIKRKVPYFTKQGSISYLFHT